MECTKLTDEERASWEEMEILGYESSPLRDGMPEEAFYFIASICGNAAREEFEWMMESICDNSVFLARYEDIPAFHRLLMRAYEHGVACGNAGCCCNLANMYHNVKNEGSTEDYATAIELYELGASRGDTQSSINLGYIYYYGRGVAVDYGRAYECFARGALQDGHPEGYWKLGDLYAGGKGVTQSDRMAWTLYKKAYNNAGPSALKSRAAHHLADYLLRGIEEVVEADPDAALRFYNEAELGYYQLIDEGLDYYTPQLNQCIEGQALARKAVQEKHQAIRQGQA